MLNTAQPTIGGHPPYCYPRRTEGLAKASKSLQPSQKVPLITGMEVLLSLPFFLERLSLFC